MPTPGGSAGNLCLGSPFGRFDRSHEVFDSGRIGCVPLRLNLSSLPGALAVQPGERWHFQCWYRDGSSSNFTDAVLVGFL
ncbi:MAG: hypothetical protein GY711_21680 [bacterium]|nr:hypothetical protein [bacterium]